MCYDNVTWTQKQVTEHLTAKCSAQYMAQYGKRTLALCRKQQNLWSGGRDYNGRAGGSHRTNGQSPPPPPPQKKVLNGKFHNSRSVGKARTGWEDFALRNALQVLGIRGWWTQVRDREEWRRHLRAARAQKGLGHCCTHISVSEEAAGQSGLSSESPRHRPQCHLEQDCLLSGVLT